MEEKKSFFLESLDFHRFTGTVGSAQLFQKQTEKLTYVVFVNTKGKQNLKKDRLSSTLCLFFAQKKCQQQKKSTKFPA